MDRCPRCHRSYGFLGLGSDKRWLLTVVGNSMVLCRRCAREPGIEEEISARYKKFREAVMILPEGATTSSGHYRYPDGSEVFVVDGREVQGPPPSTNHLERTFGPTAESGRVDESRTRRAR